LNSVLVKWLNSIREISVQAGRRHPVFLLPDLVQSTLTFAKLSHDYQAEHGILGQYGGRGSPWDAESIEEESQWFRVGRVF
jgi:hypothetical protein